MTVRHRDALYLGLFMALFLVVWTFRATSLYGIDEAITSPVLRGCYSNLMKLLIWVLPAAAFVRWLKGLKPTKYWAFSTLPSRDQWQPCLFVTAGFLLVTAAVELSVGGKSFSFAYIASKSFIVGSLSSIVSSLLEEILFRGFVLKELLSLIPMAVANVLTSLLFVAVHIPYWLSHGGLTRATVANFAGIFLFSLLAGWLFTKSRSIWPPTLAHIGNNILSLGLMARTA